ncbi:thermonuclease family protein [Candidatus Woesearchaeota archaeon]|nr:MAG: nuclease SNase-like [archaeon GW2011_AR4]MBS3129685.1 thermonuclease family protein [Candidatus Woesearchaeota archaeon]HIH38789.1 hypothetical protein [Candidatus Woesearchaeota archaeon]HIH49204.1 hypothetical protein [Candidatus Woesearchaeota archaeon]HIJ03347.1 hypothetical protein [Candidatus Woesearchaeota archaeon]
MDKESRQLFVILFAAILISFSLLFSAVIIKSYQAPTVNYYLSPEMPGDKQQTTVPQLPSSPVNLSPLVRGNLTKIVTKIIDGDTLIVEGGETVRLLSIDADETGYPCYDEASSRLSELVLNKQVILESDNEDNDKYGRSLRYVFLGGKNINVQMVTEGLAVARIYPETQKYAGEIRSAEVYAKDYDVGCKWETPKTEDSQPVIPTIPPKTALKTIAACDAKDYLNKNVIVQGVVVDSYLSKTNTLFLNFGEVYPNNCFSGVIFSPDLYKFSSFSPSYFEGKTIKITGAIKLYEGKPEIIIEYPSQIILIN